MKHKVTWDHLDYVFNSKEAGLELLSDSALV